MCACGMVTMGQGMLRGPPSSGTGCAGQDTGSGGHSDGAGGTRGCTQAGWHPSFPLQAPGAGGGRTLPGTAATRCLGMEPGPARVPARGHRALGAHRGGWQPPTQRGVSQRAKGAAGRAGTSPAVAVARSEAPRGARGRRARGQGRWMSPLCRVCPGLSPAAGTGPGAQACTASCEQL